MFNIFSKATSVAAIVLISAFAQAQWKDGQAEWNMFSAAQKETDPRKKIRCTAAGRNPSEM